MHIANLRHGKYWYLYPQQICNQFGPIYPKTICFAHSIENTNNVKTNLIVIRFLAVSRRLHAILWALGMVLFYSVKTISVVERKQ